MRTISDDPEVEDRRPPSSEEEYLPERVGRFKCTRETARAILVVAEGNVLDERWVPKSVLHEDSEVFEDETDGELVVVHWFAEKEGWL